MPRPPRIEIPGMAYHVHSNGVDGCRVFRDDEDRETFVVLLGLEVERSEWSCLEYCVLSTHFHVLLKLQKETLSSGFQHLKSKYAQLFNERYGRVGTVWRVASRTR